MEKSTLRNKKCRTRIAKGSAAKAVSCQCHKFCINSTVPDSAEKSNSFSEKNRKISDVGKSSYAGESQVNHDLAEKRGERDSVKDDVDSEGKKVYNKAPEESQNKGENNDENYNTEILARATGTLRYGDDGNRNYQGPKGIDPEKTFALLGKYQAGHRLGNRTRAGSSGVLGERYHITARDYFGGDLFRDLQRKRLKRKDSAGREISQKHRELLAETVLKNFDGTVISLYHWTPNEFKEFAKGDIGFHLGTLNSAYWRYKDISR